MQSAFHHVLFAEGATAAPEWVHLVPSGTFKGVDGRGPYTLKNPAAVIAASMGAGAKLPIDENHAIDLAAPKGGPSPARGWIVQMEAREDGIWGRVEWTETGKVLMADRSYSGISPVFLHDKSGVISRIERAALTNTPNMAELDRQLNTALTARERDALPDEMFAVPAKRELVIRDADHVRLAWDMVDRTKDLTDAERAEARHRILRRAHALGMDTSDWEKAQHAMDLGAVRKAAGLPETADEAAVLAAIAANAQGMSRHSAQLSAIATAAGLDTSLGADGLVTALQARRGAGDPDKLAEQVVSLQTQLSTLQSERARERAVAFVDGAVRGGKPIAPLRDHYIARHMADATAVETEIGKLPSINAGGVPTMVLNARGEPAGDEPTAAEKAVAEKMGIDPKKLVAQRKKREAGGEEEGKS